MTRPATSQTVRTLLCAANLSDKVVSGFVPVAKIAAMVLLVTTIFDLVSRRFFVLGSTRLQEMEWHMHVVLFALCLGYAYAKDRHVRIDLFHLGFGARRKWMIEIFGIVFLALPYLLLLLYFSAQFFWQSFVIDEPSKAALGIPHRWIIKFFLPLGIGLLIVATLGVFCRALAGLLLPPDSESTVQ
ncbi:TRAP transporter small permease subunit [Sulfitobacter sp. W074]|uniref:TRAP transporter small permease subunit n=1 Tax=Sulfitobacter sp. W074 TaxID=2867026 RepID=UPI0021A2DAB7|nr:TRAP transporter small permease subunit [Sulfitobacter sp. W074]UWR38410.1 TRAP transporter small permease subunit [Sulfitobacter sp. W074]